MEDMTEHLLDALIDQIKDGGELRKVEDQLKKRRIESLLKAELSAHLGYMEGDQLIGDNYGMAILRRPSRMKTVSGG